MAERNAYRENRGKYFRVVEITQLSTSDVDSYRHEK